MSYRHAIDNGLGGVEYVTIETPDEDYDRMKQEELDDRELHQTGPISDGFTDQRDEDEADQEYCDRAAGRE